jgi:PmbA protein
LTPDKLASLIVTEGEKLGASDVSAIISEEKKHMLRFSNNSVTVLQSWNTIAPTIHIQIGSKRAGCTIEDPSPEVIKSTVKTLMETMKLMKPEDVESRLPQGPFTYTGVAGNYDRRICSSTDELTRSVETSIDSGLNAGAKRVSGVLVATEWSRTLQTSTGSEGRERGTLLELTVRAFVDADSSGQGTSCSTTFQNFNPEVAGREAGTTAKLATNPAEGREGTYRVVLGPLVMANLLNTAASSASAHAVEIGMSFLSNKLGQDVASEKLTLTDNQQFPGGPGSHAFDDEGFPTRPTKIVERGFLRTFLHSSYTAKKYNADLTGHGYYGGPSGIIPSPSNLIVDPGTCSTDELLQEVNNGIYVTNNWYTRFQNYNTGDFSTICRDGAFMIVDGQISTPVKGLRISDNMLRIMKSIREISKDRKWIKWWEVDTPILLSHFLVDGVKMTRSTS